MALTPCPECRRDVSTEAETCPQCGYPLSRKAGLARFAEGEMAGKAVGALGAWLLAPWFARAVAVIVFGIVAIVMFAHGRN